MAERLVYLARHGDAGDQGDLSEAGREQASLLGQRLRDAGLSAVFHGPLPRAAQTASLVIAQVPGIASQPLDLVGDFPPPADQDQAGLPASYARLLASYPASELEQGAGLARAAIERFANPGDGDARELIITHNFLIGWFIRDALGAPDWRWLGLNHCNAALTAIRYQTGYPPSLLYFNDMSHLPVALRWTGFPAGLRA